MSLWGKILGGAAGFALGGPIWALVGAVAGHAVDARRQAAQDREEGPDLAALPEVSRNMAYTVALVVLGSHLARADGTVSRDEIKTFKRVFRIPAEQMNDLKSLFEQVQRDAVGFEPYARQIAHLFRGKPEILEQLLDGLFAMARADGRMAVAELAYLREVGRLFGFDEAAFARIRARHEPGLDPHMVLALSRGADDMSLHLAFRRLSQDINPDRLAAEGSSAERIAFAHDKMAIVDAAYQRLCAERGIEPRPAGGP
jgi:DnaJ like chaperone protein